jgi:hypothetical protein
MLRARIAVNATYNAAKMNMKVNMDHIKNATISKYYKMKRPFARTELKDWI